ncbi:MAG TPA: CoA-binding protein [archaeon]|nr:CoA-binding protein [archaeon]
MHDLEKFFSPQSIAVIGASRTPGKIGYTILENLKVTFQGKLYPINPNADEILGLAAFPSVLEVPEPIDLAVVSVPAEKVKSIIEECKKKKIRSCIIISSGFSEIGDKEAELELRQISKGSMRIIGPNTLGVFAPTKLDTLFLQRERLKRPSKGNIGFITQSGAVGSALIDSLSLEGVGLAKFISLGNKVDINELDCLEYMENDVEIRCISIYLESITDGRRLIELGKKVSKKKPVVILKAGKSEAGNRAVASHTGALAGPYAIASAAMRQAGFIEVESSEELFDASKALADQPILKDKKIAIITDGGGFGILAADAATKLGLELPELSDHAKKVLKNLLPKYASIANPIDLTGDATSERYKKTLDAVFKDGNIAGVVLVVLLQIPTLDDNVLTVIRDCKIYGKPFTVCMMGSQWTQERTRKLQEFGVPVYPTPERAVKAMHALYRYGQYLKENTTTSKK